MKNAVKIIFAFPFLFMSCQQQKEEEPTPEPTAPEKNEIVTEAAFVYGIDISQFQGDEIDFLSRKKDSLTFVLCKATEGVTLIDADFDNNWEMIKKEGFIPGTYHFYHCIDNPQQQAKFFMSVADDITANDLPPVVDVEEASMNTSCTAVSVKDNLLVFLKELQQLSGRTPIIYTDNHTANVYLTDAAFAAYPLYIADWSGGKTPLLPTAWKAAGWALWQKSDTYPLDAETNDLDMFNGNLEAFHQFIKTH